jgi:hypothetical protein
MFMHIGSAVTSEAWYLSTETPLGMAESGAAARPA